MILRSLSDGLRILKRPPAPEKKFGLRDAAYFLRFVRPVWKLGVISIALTVFIAAVKSVMPLSTKVLIDFVFRQDSGARAGVAGLLASLGLGAYTADVLRLLSSIDVVVLGLLAIGIVYGMLQIAQGYLMMRYQQELTFNLQRGLFDRVLRYPLSFFKDRQTGYLVSRVSNDVNMLQYFFSTFFTQTLSNALYVLFSLGILLTLNRTLVLIILGTVPVYLFLNYFFSSRVRAMSNQEMESNARLTQDMQEVFSGVEVVKAYTAEEKEVRKVSGRIRSVIDARISATILALLSGAISQGIQLILLLMVMWFGAGEIRRGAMTIGDYTAFVAYIALLTGSVNGLLFSYLSMQPMLASMDRLKEMFGFVPEYRAPTGKPLARPANIKWEIKFENVSFAYKADEPVLDNVSFTVRQGETLTIVGPSGAGKTTLINLLLKFYTPQSGAIYLDKYDIGGLDHEWLRKQIGIVSQDIFLFNDTIENNIKYGNAAATREEVVRAAKKAHIHEDIEAFPKGYDTIVGERGTMLSVGQRQRVSIARAFLKDMPILVLDEPTSALDVATEKHLIGSLKELAKGRTTLIISHRLSLADIADEVIVLDGGRIMGGGTRAKPLDIKINETP